MSIYVRPSLCEQWRNDKAVSTGSTSNMIHRLGCVSAVGVNRLPPHISGEPIESLYKLEIKMRKDDYLTIM